MVSPVTRRFPYRLFYRNLMSRLTFSSVPGKTYTCKGGSAPYPPKMLLALLFYGHAKGIFSSRKIERATYELIPVLYLTGGPHPDHDSINTFRQRFLPQFERLFVQVLLIAHALGGVKLGEVSLDGTKIAANASKHHTMSGAYAERLEQQ